MRTLKAEENSLATLTDDEINFGNKSARAVLKVMRDLILRPVDLIIAGRFNYSTDLFDPETVGRMAAHLTTLLESVVANPDQRISELPILTAHERQRICVEWNSTRTEYPADLCLHHPRAEIVEPF